MNTCTHCSLELSEIAHPNEHPEQCCDCFDLSFGMSLSAINEERAAKGRPPIASPYPGRNAKGECTHDGPIRCGVCHYTRKLT